MKPSNVGQVVKFHSPLADEDPNQLYVLLEIKGEDETARVDIKSLNSRLPFSSIQTVKLDDIVVVDLPTDELIGHNVSIVDKYGKITTGKAVKTNVKMINLRLNKIESGVETNVEIAIIDKEGTYREGLLYVS